MPVPPSGARRRLLRPPRFRAEVWRRPEFVWLWAGQTISQTGSQVSAVALPLIAVQQLNAGAAAMGVLFAVGRLPYLLYLVAGVWVDRVRKRPVLIGTDLAQGVLLLLVPVLAFTHLLSLTALAAVLCAAVGLSVWFSTAYMTYLPSLVEERLLLPGNTIMESSNSATQLVGPSLGGLLVAVITAPGAVIADALSFFVSAFCVGRIRRPEPAPEAAAPGVRAIARDLVEGVAFVARQRVLAPLAVAIGLSNAAWAAELALYILYLDRELGLPPALIGLTVAAAGPGAVVGSAVAGRVQRRIGVAGAIIGGLGLFAVSTALVPLAPAAATAPLWLTVAVLMVAAFGMSLGGQVCAVNVLTTRQLITPTPLLGRVNASFRFVGVGLAPLGALLGGVLGAAWGLRPALFAAVAVMAAAPLVAAASPVRHLRELPRRESGAPS